MANEELSFVDYLEYGVMRVSYNHYPPRIVISRAIQDTNGVHVHQYQADCDAEFDFKNFLQSAYNDYKAKLKGYGKVDFTQFKKEYARIRIHPLVDDFSKSHITAEFSYRGKLYTKSTKCLTSQLCFAEEAGVVVDDLLFDLYKLAVKVIPEDFGPVLED